MKKVGDSNAEGGNRNAVMRFADNNKRVTGSLDGIMEYGVVVVLLLYCCCIVVELKEELEIQRRDGCRHIVCRLQATKSQLDNPLLPKTETFTCKFYYSLQRRCHWPRERETFF